MFSKLLIASSAVLTTDALKLKSRAKHDVGEYHDGDLSCDANEQRWHDPQEINDFAWYSGDPYYPYEDPSFPAEESSLFWANNIYDTSEPGNVTRKYREKLQAGSLHWKRPSELVKDGKPSLWGPKGYPVPNGSQQGGLGDCWFLSAAASLAEYPERITNLFTNTEYDPAGIFQVKFFHMGEWIPITIDDRLPWWDGEQWYVPGLVNTYESKQGAWWLPILEKAYAKFNVNYSHINGGDESQALREMTGMPVINYDPREMNNSEFWDLVTDGDAKHYSMTAGCCRNDDIYGLYSGHAYTMLGAIELSGGPKLVKMRNPWGKETYNGPFSDTDGKNDWTDQWLKEAGHTFADDGTFFIPLDYWMNAFYSIGIALYNDWSSATTKWDKPHGGGTGSNDMGTRKWTSDCDQEVVLFIERRHLRQIPKHCPQRDNLGNINYYLDGQREAYGFSNFLAQKGIKMDVKKGETHSLQLYNWGNGIAKDPITATVYADKNKGCAVRWL